ncbi:MAG: sporulation-control protein spo0M, partial [Pirellulaceae bacterium]
MSRCNISISFDNADRVYQPGETISGEISVQVNKDTNCSGLIVEQFWQTHGRGNTDRGECRTVILDEGMWQAGEQYHFPFSFATPDGPPTYHGKYLNIDHYIEVRVDVPWAFDPTHREEFILLPGDRPYAYGPEITETMNTNSSLAKWAGVPFLVIAAILVFTPLFFIGIPLLIGALFFVMRNFMAEKRIGKVDVQWDSLSVVPGERIRLNIHFVPKVAGKLNAIT